MLVKLLLAQEAINQLQKLRKSQDGPIWPVDPINPSVSLQAVHNVAGVFWYISKPRPDLHLVFGTAPKRGGVARVEVQAWRQCRHCRMRSWVSFTPLGKWRSDDGTFLSELLAWAAGIKPLCHWVSNSYLSGHEVIWSHSSLFKNGALPHQFVLWGLFIIEGAAVGARWWKFECGGR